VSEADLCVREKLVAAGFTDLDRRNAFVFHEIASVLQHRRLDSFEEVNECVGSKNAIGSGAVWQRVVQLQEHGYVEISQGWAVRLTEKGGAASHCLGMDPAPRT
jgi:hypothetical protein